MTEKTAVQKCDELPCVLLGTDDDTEIVEVDLPAPQTTEERIACLEVENRAFKIMFDSLFKMVKALHDASRIEQDNQIAEFVKKNKEHRKIPVGTQLYGTTRGKSFFLEVSPNGFMVGNTTYPSLSAAAEGVSGVRRSGLAFWKFSDNRSVKDVYERASLHNA